MSAFVTLQKILPKKLITELAGKLAEVRWPPLKNRLISIFQKHYSIDLAEAKIKDPENFSNFNQFFTRELAEGARPIASGENEIVSPADGFVSEFGTLHRESLLQAKDIYYSAPELVANKILGAGLARGNFFTVYLSPSDYHRVHVPVAAELLSITYVPGKLFSVNDTTARSLDGLFTHNERVVAHFKSETFDYALVMVGAMIVGGIETVVTGPIKRQTKVVELGIGAGRRFATGEEFGRFHLGSTAIMIFPKTAGVGIKKDLETGSRVRMGEALATLS
ncbi:UNVERIFIED_CONTAM: hypothetical protein GTU68_008641 [Idotea baltica]|nr:hypothetical protein [Idotea baltica]